MKIRKALYMNLKTIGELRGNANYVLLLIELVKKVFERIKRVRGIARIIRYGDRYRQAELFGWFNKIEIFDVISFYIVTEVISSKEWIFSWNVYSDLFIMRLYEVLWSEGLQIKSKIFFLCQYELCFETLKWQSVECIEHQEIECVSYFEPIFTREY